MTENSLKEAMAHFKIEDEQLAEIIKKRAFRSGHFPHKKRMSDGFYKRELRLLQIELLKLLNHVKEKGERVVIVFEGRDAAGKGGAIARVTQHLNPRSARVIALSKPTDVEKGQFYFQRYMKEMPTKGEMTLFDRSWYNRAVVEPVMGFSTTEQTDEFLKIAPIFEDMLVKDGIKLIKIWLHVGHAMQLKRLHKRYSDPLKRWKLSPIDYQGIGKWDDYTLAIERMLTQTNHETAPWTIIRANDKNRARLAVIRHILKDFSYPDRNDELIARQDLKITLSAEEFLAQGGEE